MGVKTSIQAKLIALFKVNEYEVVTYDGDGIPSTGAEKATPRVVCNEVSATMTPIPGQTTTQVLTDWSFDLILSFDQEIDYSDYIMSLDNISYAYSEDILVEINIGSSILVTHPPTKGGHNGTELRFNLTVNIKK